MTVKWVIAFCVLQMGLSLLFRNVWRPLASVHAWVTLAFGLYLCLGKNRPIQIVQWVAYVAGAEVLWRMCGAKIPWEFAKYAIALVCIISMVRANGFRGSWLPALYFGLLFPASLFSFIALPLEDARQQVSFALSGPFCLAIFALWCPVLRLTINGFLRVGVALLAPIVGVGFLVLYRLITNPLTVFGTASTSEASGGYGPNQISAILSLGALLAMFAFLGEKRSRTLQVWYAAVGLWLLAQATLTFSRTGVYLFGAAFGLALIFLVQWKGRKSRLLFLAVVLGSGVCILLPMLDAFTGGSLEKRYNDTGLTGRDDIAKMDIQIFREHPLMGVGAGMSGFYRAALGDEHAAHTEYTRLLADHGLFGLTALLVLIVMSGIAFLKAPDPWSKAIVVALAIWGFLFISVTAMRLAAPSFALGLIHARFLKGSQVPGTAKGPARGLVGPRRVSRTTGKLRR